MREFKYTRTEFIDRANEIHNDRYDYSLLTQPKLSSKIEIICSSHGSFFQKGQHHISGAGCKKCGIESRSGTNSVPYKKMAARLQNRANIVDVNLGGLITLQCQTHGNVSVNMYRYTNHNSSCPECEKESYQNGKSLWELYYTKVRRVTEQSWKYRNGYINHYGVKRSRDGFHLDHQLSIYDGFSESIPPFIVGHWTNLWLMPKTENLKKNRHSVISKELLYRNFFWAYNKFNDADIYKGLK